MLEEGAGEGEGEGEREGEREGEGEEEEEEEDLLGQSTEDEVGKMLRSTLTDLETALEVHILSIHTHTISRKSDVNSVCICMSRSQGGCWQRETESWLS